MKIGNGKQRNEDGTVDRTKGYAKRCGKSLAELLKENGAVKVVAMGEAASNNAMKALIYAQENLKEECKDLIADEFSFTSTTLTNKQDEEVEARLVSVIVKLV